MNISTWIQHQFPASDLEEWLQQNNGKIVFFNKMPETA